jgi:hypothetical protein
MFSIQFKLIRISTLTFSKTFLRSTANPICCYDLNSANIILQLSPPLWRTTPCQLSATAYSMYSQLPSITGGRSSIRKLRTRHAVVTGTHLTWINICLPILIKNHFINSMILLQLFCTYLYLTGDNK